MSTSWYVILFTSNNSDDFLSITKRSCQVLVHHFKRQRTNRCDLEQDTIAKPRITNADTQILKHIEGKYSTRHAKMQKKPGA